MSRFFPFELAIAKLSLTIIPRVRVGYELINCLLKTPTKYREFFPTLFVRTTDFQILVCGSYTMMAKPIRAL